MPASNRGKTFESIVLSEERYNGEGLFGRIVFRKEVIFSFFEEINAHSLEFIYIIRYLFSL